MLSQNVICWIFAELAHFSSFLTMALSSVYFVIGCRPDFGTTCSEGRTKFKCHFDSLPNSLCWLLSFCQAYTSISEWRSHLDLPFICCDLENRADLDLTKLVVSQFCRRQCLMNMPCDSPSLEVRCCCHCSCFLSSYQKTWLMLCWQATFLYLGLSLFRMFFPYLSTWLYVLV